MGVGYSIYDFTHDSHAEKERDKYKHLCNALSSKISSIESDLPLVKQAIDNLHGYYTLNPNSAKGYLGSTYVTKENVFYSNCMAIYNGMNNALSELRSKKASAEECYNYWENECELEDEEEKTRTYD